MPKPKLGISKYGKEMHCSVGAIIEKNSKYLLIDRKIEPFGFACIAGHIDEDETPEEALIREVKEESGLDVKNYKLVGDEELGNNFCSKGVNVHYWYIFKCETNGEINRSIKETKSINWYSKKEIKKLNLEKPAWEYWFKKLKII